MSSRPQNLFWTVRRSGLPLVALRCPRCRAELATAADRSFRINANGKLLDVWLLVRCLGCDRTAKLTVHERIPVRSVRLDAYESGDDGLVAQVLMDPHIARRHRFTLDWTGAWRLDAPAPPPHDWPIRVEVSFLDPVPLRPAQLIAEGLGLSCGEAERRIKCDVSLNRTTSTDFTFTILPVGG